MLVMSRKHGESIVLITDRGERIVITNVLIDRNKVRIGVEADVTTQIYREEILPDYLKGKYGPTNGTARPAGTDREGPATQ